MVSIGEGPRVLIMVPTRELAQQVRCREELIRKSGWSIIRMYTHTLRFTLTVNSF